VAPAPAIRNSSRFTARRKLQPQTTIQPCVKKCAHWNLRRKTHSLARYIGSLWVFSTKSALGTMRTAGTSPSGKPSSAPPLVNVSLSLFPSPSNPTPEQHAGATSSSLTCTATTLALGWTLSHTRCGLSCFIAQIAFPLTTFGPRLSIHPAVISTNFDLDPAFQTAARFWYAHHAAQFGYAHH